MSRLRYPFAWISYHVADLLDRMRCPTFARAVDWLYYRVTR